MKTFFSLLQIIPIFVLIGCGGNSTNYQPFPLSNIQTDFPECDTLKFEEFNTYDIYDMSDFVIRDSTLWQFTFTSREYVGFCYNLSTGEKYSSIANFGRAANELDNQYRQYLVENDSLYFLYSHQGIVKSIAKKDIINNVPLGERVIKKTRLPDSLFIQQIVKLPNGCLLATNAVGYSQAFPTTNEDVNSPLVLIINNNNIKTYPVIDYNTHHFKMHSEQQFSRVDFIRHSYATGRISCQNNTTAVFSVNNQGILYTLDLTNGKVINEKRYSEMKCESDNVSSSNDLDLYISHLESNDKYIFCIISGYMNQLDKKENKHKRFMLVFDWNLTPIKRFSLSRSSFFSFSKDNPSVIYEKRLSNKGLTLYKANVNL